MKLSDQYSISSLFISLFILLTGAVFYYFGINFIAQQQLDQNLEMQLREAEEFLTMEKYNPQLYDLDKDHAMFFEVKNQQIKKRFFDTVYINPVNKIIEPGRAIEDVIKTNLTKYKVIITISRLGNIQLVKFITLITSTLLVILISILFFTNRYLLKSLWAPFYNTLKDIKDFNLADLPYFEIKASIVDEFSELNQAIHEMSLRIKDDYVNLKQITENASHELMTPLAVVTTKLDTLIQDETLTSEQLEQIVNIYSSIKKSIRLNQSLILLTKLENKVIPDEREIDVSKIIYEKIEQFQPLYQSKEINISSKICPTFVKGSDHLFEILVSNLFTNAIRHNYEKGNVEIYLSADQLVFKNTGSDKPLLPKLIFQRFQKGEESRGMGLGLTLVKYICQHHNYNLFYTFEDNKHVFSVKFR